MASWQLAQAEISRAQGRQKKFHDREAKQPVLQVGDRVFVYSPSKKQGKAYKLARPFMGPYRVLKLYTNGADLRLIAKPAAASIRVALNRIRICTKEITESSVAVQLNPDPSDNSDRVGSMDTLGAEEGDSQQDGTSQEMQSTSGTEIPGATQGPWSGLLRNRH